MKSTTRLLFSILFLLSIGSSYSQDTSEHEYSKNIIDIGGLGNKGLIFVGYNRAVIRNDKVELLVGPCVGYVPSSREDTLNSIPRFVHLIIGTNFSYKIFSFFEVVVGGSYSKILLGDPYHVNPKSNYDRILADLGIIMHFAKDEGFGLKLSYNPMLFDNGADDIEGFPFGLTLRIVL